MKALKNPGKLRVPKVTKVRFGTKKGVIKMPVKTNMEYGVARISTR